MNHLNDKLQTFKDDQLEVWFQPQYSHSTGALLGAEALARIHTSKQGYLLPSDFIPTFEREGVITKFDSLVIKQVCKYIREWLDKDYLVIPISVNISETDLLQPDFLSNINEICLEYHITPKLIKLEVKEKVFEYSNPVTIKTIESLIQQGFVIEVDNFGTNGSSLSTLNKINTSVIKLDMAQFKDEKASLRSRKIIESIVNLIQLLNINIIAENVENKVVADYLSLAGCDSVQGYYYNGPMIKSDFEHLLSIPKNSTSNIPQKKITTIKTEKNKIEDSSLWDKELIDTFLFNKIVNSACIIEYTKNNIHIVRANAKSLKTLGLNSLTLEKLQELNWELYLTKNDQKTLHTTLKKVIKTEDDVSCELLFENVPGCKKEIYCRNTYRLLAKKGDKYLIYCSVEVVTPPKNAKQNLLQIRTFINNINNSFIGYTFKQNTFKILIANKAFFKIINEDCKTDVTTLDLTSYIHPDDKQKVLKTITEANNNLENYSLLYRIVRKDGTIRWVESKITISRLQGIKSLFHISITTDKTEEFDRTEKEHQLTQQLNAIMSNASCGITATIVKDKPQILFANDMYYELLGYTKEQFSNEVTSPINTIYPKDLEKALASVNYVSKTRNKESFETRIICRDKSIKWVIILLSVTRFSNIEDPVQLAIYTDITEKKQREEELRIHEEELHAAISQVGKTICEFDPISKDLIIPEDYATLLGIPEKLTNLPENLQTYNLFEPSQLQNIFYFYNLIYAGETRGSLSINIKHKDNSWHYEYHEFINILNNDGKPIKTIIAIEDITEQKALLMRFDHENELRQNLLNEALIYYEINLTKLEVIEYHNVLNDVPLMKSGKALSELIRLEILKKVIDSDKSKVRNTLFSKALLQAYQQGKTNITLEYRRLVDSDTYHWLRASIIMMTRPDTKDITAFLYIIDIDREKKNKIALHNVISNEIEIVAILTVKSRTIRLVQSNNQINYEDNEVSFDYFISTLDASLIHKDDLPSFMLFSSLEDLVEKLTKENSISLVFRVIQKDGTYRRKSILALFLDETKQDIIISQNDITALYEEEQRKNNELMQIIEQVKKANNAKSDFLSRMSHDMRTPLNAILAFSCSELTEDVDVAQLHENIKKIHSSGDFLLGIINDVLDTAKIEQGKMKLLLSPYSLIDFEQNIKTVITELCKPKQITFTYTDINRTLDFYMLDKVRFNQIFMNLLSNAVKFTPLHGKIDFYIENITPVQDGYITKRFTVRDNGIGMSKEYLPHAFESFSQEYREETSPNTQGTGLGLSIVKEIVKIMNGTINVESIINKGTVFYIELPLKIANKDQLPIKTSNSFNSSLKDTRVLLCEDTPINIEIVKKLLNKVGCIVDSAKNGKEGLYIYYKSTPGYYNAILMDIRMPVMNGLDATIAIRAADRADSKTIPIIAMTADAFAEDEKIAYNAGMNAHISKPFEPDDLYNVLSKMINPNK